MGPRKGNLYFRGMILHKFCQIFLMILFLTSMPTSGLEADPSPNLVWGDFTLVPKAKFWGAGADLEWKGLGPGTGLWLGGEGMLLNLPFRWDKAVQARLGVEQRLPWLENLHPVVFAYSKAGWNLTPQATPGSNPRLTLQTGFGFGDIESHEDTHSRSGWNLNLSVESGFSEALYNATAKIFFPVFQVSEEHPLATGYWAVRAAYSVLGTSSGALAQSQTVGITNEFRLVGPDLGFLWLYPLLTVFNDCSVSSLTGQLHLASAAGVLLRLHAGFAEAGGGFSLPLLTKEGAKLALTLGSSF